MNQGIVKNVNSSRRNESLDIIKGGLVCVMLLYHSVSVSNFAELRVVTSRVDFIHYAFLLITGFLCGYHYHGVSHGRKEKVSQRLFVRASKLLAIFICTNIFYHAFGYGRGYLERLSSLRTPMDVIKEILVGIPGEFVAFEILYLIAAFLAVAAILIRFDSVKWMLGLMVLAPLMVEGLPILFIAFGCVGMLGGIFAQEGQLVYMEPIFRRFIWIFPLLLLGQMIFLSPFVNWQVANEWRLLFVTAETLVWSFTFLWLVDCVGNRWIKEQIILLGRYTLLAYIFQMVSARIVYVVLSGIGLKNFSYYGLSLILVTTLTWVVIICIERLRKSWREGDRIYRLVFQ